MEKKELIIKIQGLSKDYILGQIGATTLMAELQSFMAKIKGKENPNELIETISYTNNYNALKNINIEIYRGDTLGIIGGNGAGKSTLLKILSRITTPTRGTFCYNGRISSMLEVGTGFNGEMTGRENIYLNGAILGMSKTEVDNKMEQIIEFSECRTFIDTPVKRYSSGMYVKLAFAVASHLDSEILIMDEVLAVGDMKFQKKCLERMRNLAKQEGKTVLYVSHNMATIRQLCNRCIVLSQGELLFDGDTETAINVYMDEEYDRNNFYNFKDTKRTIQTKNVRLDAFEILNGNNNNFDLEEIMEANVYLSSLEGNVDVFLRLLIYYADGSVVGVTSKNIGKLEEKTSIVLNIRIDISDFVPGKYHMLVALWDGDSVFGSQPYDAPVKYIFFEINNSNEKEPYWDHLQAGHRILREIIVY